MNWYQKEIALRPRPRGFHLVTQEIVGQVPEIGRYAIGLAHIFILHTSASLTLNENADPTVRQDMEAHFNQTVPENAPYYRHIYEGSDDMPAHIKAVLLGNNLMLPIQHGRFRLGTWQGIYLGEHRNRANGRRLIITLQGKLETG